MFVEAVEQIIKKNEKMLIVSAIVSEVNEESFTASRKGMADLLEVRLNSVLTDVKDAVLIVPKLKSVVLLGIIENNKAEAVLLKCSEVEKIEIRQSGLEFEISQGKFVFKNKQANLKAIIANALNAIKQATIPTPSGGIGALDPASKGLIELEVKNLDKLFK